MTTAIVLLVLFLAVLLVYVFSSGPRLPVQTDGIIEEVMGRDLPELVSGTTGLVSSYGLKIWYESILPPGPPKGTALLIAAMGGHALEWTPTFVQQLLVAGYHVVRYDQRGTGMSDWVEDWSFRKPYSLAEMAGDVIALLDALNIQEAHLLGLSMGGMIAQEVAIQQPGRVASLTLLMTSGFIGDPNLPSATSRFFLTSIVKGLPLLKYRMLGGEKKLIKERIAKHISVVGYGGLDIRETAEFVLYDLRKRRGINVRAILQHQAAVWTSGSRYEKLESLDIPALVIHGREDQLIPFEHGRKLVQVIPNAKGLWLDGVGHIFPVADMSSLMETILTHLNEHSTHGAFPAAKIPFEESDKNAAA